MQIMTCPICNTDIATQRPSQARFCKCPGCGFQIRQLDDQQDKMKKLYAASWQSPDEFVSETGATDPRLARVYMQFLMKELGITSLSGMKILDFGAGKGDVLQVLSEMGADVVGYEPFGYQQLIQRGFKAFETLEEAARSGPYDGVVSIDVVEHLISPVADTGQIHAMLKNGGWMYAATPNNQSLRAQLSGDGWEEAHREGHLFLFSSESLKKLMINAGFVRVNRIKWVIPYSDQQLKRLLNAVLTAVRLDGELRYLGYKSK